LQQEAGCGKSLSWRFYQNMSFRLW
jgi:hypothetical protein